MSKQTFHFPKDVKRDLLICSVVDALEDLPADEGFRLEIHEHKSTRTELQNNTLWWIYTQILKLGGATMEGWTKNDLHEFFLCEHFGFVIKVVFGRKRHVPKRRSSGLSKSEFAKLVDFIYSFMANEGVVLPLPDPNYMDHREEQAA